MLNPESPGTLEEAEQALLAPEVPEAPTAPADVPAPAPDAQPRDPQGRYAKPSEEPAAEVPAPAPETPASPTPTEPAPPEPEESYPEATYRADGQEYAVGGSAVGEDGTFIPAASWPEVQQLLAEGRAARGSVRQRLGEAAQREQAAAKRAEAAEAQSQHVLGHFETLIERSQSALASGDVNQILQSPIGQWLLSTGQSWPILKADARAKALELQSQVERDELARYREQADYQRLRPVMDQTLERAIAERGAMLGLNDDALSDVYEVLSAPDMEGAVFVRAPADDPMAGFRKGELVINYQPVDKALQLAAASARRAKAQQPKPVVPKPVIPPTVGGKGATAPRPGKAVPTFTSREEADKWFERGGYEDLDIPEE